ncbi:hypothetical protein DFP72DRAFT_1071806 [Ephemerocybe angulata]|uniref:Uncharacterized protein n=1 Tax=Ephemerocybe angulata TaxID=980116 RepID=A0A8H6M4A0_9AGAR|nr:hypothetical protein DFP72DRAFT_1071806 [Tulosesus angulatus]
MPARRPRRQERPTTSHEGSSEGSVAPPYPGGQAPPPYSGDASNQSESRHSREEEDGSDSEDDSEARRSLLFEPASNVSLAMPGQMPRTEPRAPARSGTPPRNSPSSRGNGSPALAAPRPMAPSRNENAPAAARTFANFRATSPAPNTTFTFGEFAKQVGPTDERSPTPSDNMFFRPSPTNPFNSRVYQPHSNLEAQPNTKPEVKIEPISSIWSQIANGSKYEGTRPHATEGARTGEQNNLSRPIQSISAYPRSSYMPMSATPLSPIRENQDSGGAGSRQTFLEPKPDSQDDGTFSVTLEPLRKVGLPLLDGTYVETERMEETILEIPTCLSTTTFSRGGTDGFAGIVGRYYTAVRYAEDALKRKIPTGRHFDCPEAREFFSGEYAALNELLTHIWRYTSEAGRKGYRVDTDRWREFSTRMDEIRDHTKEALMQSGEGILNAPRWGPTGRVVDIWDLNDFEILSVGFRAETELFLNKVTKAVLEQSKRQKSTSPEPASSTERNAGAKKDKGKQPMYSYGTAHHSQDVSNSAHSRSENNLNPRSQPAPSRNPTQIPNPFLSASNGLAPAERNNFTAREQVEVNNNPFMIPSATRGNFVESASYRPTNNVTQSIYGSVRNESTSHRFQQMLQPLYPAKDRHSQNTQATEPVDDSHPTENRESQVRFSNYGLGPSDSPSSSSSESDDEGEKRGPRAPRNRPRSGKKIVISKDSISQRMDEPRVDTRLKVEMIPKWDGDLDNLGRWVIKLNSLALQSKRVCKQMGSLVPTRLEGSAERWYYSLHISVRAKIETSWETLRDAICQYYMNRTYMEKQKARANRATYRDHANPKETPSEYFIRKMELLQLAYQYNDRELIHEILSGAPTHWSTILTPHIYFTIEEIQTAVKYHEDVLMQYDLPRSNFSNNGPSRSYNRNPFYGNFKNSQARTNLVGATENTKPPQFPKDDSNISKRGTPESKGGRPCRHCGSGKHWDYECRHSRRGERKARANFIELDNEEIEAQRAYDDLYYNLESEEETDF